VTLADATDFAGFRRACRELWAAQVAPEHVSWHCADDAELDLFDAEPQAGAVAAAVGGAAAVTPVHAPAAFLPLSESAVLHSDPERFALLYRLLWRFQVEPGLRADPIDPDWLRADEMAQAVRRDMHKMKAFVRFRPITALREALAMPMDVPDDAPTDNVVAPTDGLDVPPIRHVAWFEPEHHVVEAVAPFFARRFAQMRWSILTPERSVRWDGSTLEFGPGARREDAPPADAGESLWLTYYESIFNPARLKLAMMQREMPRRYWRNLPEAQLISPLSAAAAQRSMDMITRSPTTPSRRRPAAAPATEPNQPVPIFERPLSAAQASLDDLRAGKVVGRVVLVP